MSTVVGRLFKGSCGTQNGVIFFAESYDPSYGYLMVHDKGGMRCEHHVSERAIGRTFHEVHGGPAPRCGQCNACWFEVHGCGCDGAVDDGCFLCNPSQHSRPPCPPVEGAMKKLKTKETIAIDFDDVIHRNVAAWTIPKEINDGPVPGALEFILEISETYDIAIFSARANSRKAINAIYDWLLHYGLPPALVNRIRVTANKPSARVYIDDRAWRFQGTFPSLEELAAFEHWKFGREVKKETVELFSVEEKHLEQLKAVAVKLSKSSDAELREDALKIMMVVRFSQSLQALRGPGEPYVHLTERTTEKP